MVPLWFYMKSLINLIYSSTVIKYYRKTLVHASTCMLHYYVSLRWHTIFSILKLLYWIFIFLVVICDLLCVSCSYWWFIRKWVHCWPEQLKLGRHTFKWPYDQIKFSRLNHTGITKLNSLKMEQLSHLIGL